MSLDDICALVILGVAAIGLIGMSVSALREDRRAREVVAREPDEEAQP